MASLEAAADEEMKEIMNILEGRDPNHGISGRHVPPPIRTRSPAQQVRSMLDIGIDANPRHNSIAGPSITSPLRSAPITSSLLNPRSSPTIRSTASNSPVTVEPLSRASSLGGLSMRPRAGSNQDEPYSKDQFGMAPSVTGPAAPKRVTQGGKKIGSMATVMQGQELDPIFPGGLQRDRGRHNSTAGILGHGHTSKSPSSRLNKRSDSPATSMLNTNSFNLMSDPGKYVSENGKVIDLTRAFQKLSDKHLLAAGSTLSTTAADDHAARARLNSGEMLSPTGEIRLGKDYGEDALESSDDEAKTSDEEAWGSRGRKRESKDDLTREAQSLLAAAEEERKQMARKQKVKSLLDIDGPATDKSKKLNVHPNTAFNAIVSRSGSPNVMDDGEIDDIKRAQQLAIHMSPVDSTIPHRVIRTIIRGDFTKMQQEAAEGERKIRTYIVATDLSGEAAYALEWTIGTVLRDGDTLLAMYCAEEEVNKSGEATGSPTVQGLPVGEGGTAIQEATETMARQTELARRLPGHNTSVPPSPLRATHLRDEVTPGSRSRQGSSARNISRLEQERHNAVDAISATCVRFLRKTKLQVRIAVEVIHCKSPKHMITEAIDELEPVMVILGSRGRSSLKGVLLGSFSNYLVTKSSVPVMVARKKLQTANSRGNKILRGAMANNLTPIRTLADAKID